MYIFYSPDILNNKFCLSPEESKHCVKVLRNKKSDLIHIMDGKGSFYEAEITEASSTKTMFEIREQKNVNPRDFYVHIAIAPTKNINRFEWFLEKATEMGIDEITPVLCDNSERKVIKNDRLEKIIVSASKQSKQAYIPKLNLPFSFQEFMSNTWPGRKLIAHCYGDEKSFLKNEIVKQSKNLILIGPEGDFSLKEIDLALSNEYKEISLGDSRLRTETAGLVACFTNHLVNQ